MDRHERIVLITVGLAGAGAVLGAVAAVVGFGALMAAVALSKGMGASVFFPEAFVLAAQVGAALGAVLGPAAGWLLLRSVPLGRALTWTTFGTAAGALIGSPVPFGAILGALAGFAVACLWLRHRARVA